MRAISSTFVLFISLFGLACCVDVGTADRVMPKSKVEDRNSSTINSSESTPINQCSCTDKNIWIDVYFLIDSSQAMTAHGFDEATSFAESVLYKLNIGQADGQHTRAGFISYSANAYKNYDLTAFQSSNDMIDNSNFTYDGNRGTNIESALNLAAESFETPSHRRNVQKVIVIIAVAYESGKYNDPTKVARTFVQDGGFKHRRIFASARSTGTFIGQTFQWEYSFTNRYGNLTAEQIRQAFCKINCFCPTNYLPFMRGDVTPSGGCYIAVSTPAIRTLATRDCRQYHEAYLVKVESREKSQFLSTAMDGSTNAVMIKTTSARVYRAVPTTIVPQEIRNFREGVTLALLMRLCGASTRTILTDKNVLFNVQEEMEYLTNHRFLTFIVLEQHEK